jgi:drug/metabolite transporter (DMT)-like permease
MQSNLTAKPLPSTRPQRSTTPAPAVESASSGRSLSVWLALLTVYIIWGSTYLAIRIALEGFPPFLMAGTRFLLAGSLMFVFLRLRGEPNPARKEWGGAALVGMLLLFGGNGMVTFAEQWVASGLAALAVATVPIFAALFAGLWSKWPSRQEWLGLVVGLAGVALLNLEGDMRANPIGAIALFFATASWALGSVWSRYLPMPKGAMASAAEMLAGGAGLLILAFSTGEQMTSFPEPRPLLALIYLVIFGSIVAFTAYSYLLQRVRPSLATSYAYVNPVVAVGLGVGLAGEQVTLFGLIAMPIILLGVAIVVLARSKRSA